MRILIIQPWIDYRGAETTCVYLAYHLKKLGHQTKIICLYKADDRLPHLVDKVEVSSLPSALAWLCRKSRLFLFIFGGPLLFIKVILAGDADVLNPHNLPAYWIASLVGSLKKIPVIWTAHTVPAGVKLSESRDLVDYLTWLFGSSGLDKYFVRNIKNIIVSGKFLQKLVLDRYGREAKIVPLGINLEIFKRTDRLLSKKRLGLEKGPIILNVGTLRADKNQDILIKVFKKVLKDFSSARLIICGSGPGEKFLHRVTRDLGLDRAVIFPGFIVPKDLVFYYAAADLYVLPSKLETWGLTAFEALSQKTVPLVSPMVGCSKILQQKKIGLVASSRVKDLTLQIKRALMSDGIKEMGIRGFNFVHKNLSWEKYAEDTETIFKEAVNGQKS